MRIAFISGPYRAPTIRGIVENIRKAEAISIELWKMGYAVITPHLNTALFDGACPDDIWLKGDLEILKRCDLVVMAPDWSKSDGAMKEFGAAVDLNLPIFYWPENKKNLEVFADA